MAKITVAAISKHAKRIRKKGEKWLTAIKRSARELKGSSTPARKKKKVGATKYRQTGTSNKKRDQERPARAPGKRKSRSGKVYYERRRNRSDMPGKLTGIGIGALKSELRKRSEGNLAAGLLAKDKATTLKQHRAAMKRIATARKALKAVG